MAKKKRNAGLTAHQQRRTADAVMLSRLKSLGVTKADAIAVIGRGIDALAAEGSWRASETAATKADIIMVADEVWQ